MKNCILALSLVLSAQTFAGTCVADMVQAQLDNPTITKKLDELYDVKEAAQSLGNFPLAEQAENQKQEIYDSIYTLAHAVCSEL